MALPAVPPLVVSRDQPRVEPVKPVVLAASGRASVTGIADRAVRPGVGPVSVRAPGDAAKAGVAPRAVDVEVLDETRARQIGSPALTFTVKRADGITSAGKVGLEIDLAGFESAGAEWMFRAQLVRYPSCVLTRPRDPKCATYTVVPSQRDWTRKVLSADVETTEVDAARPDPGPAVRSVYAGFGEGRGSGTGLPKDFSGLDVAERPGGPSVKIPAPAKTTGRPRPPTGAGEAGPSPEPPAPTAPGEVDVLDSVRAMVTSFRMAVGFVRPEDGVAEPVAMRGYAVLAQAPVGSPVVYGLVGGVGGPTGTYAATALSSGSSSSVNANLGSFQWSYSLAAPPTPAGFSQPLQLNYSSAAVDGMSSEARPQPSPLGLGFSNSIDARIERVYWDCAALGTVGVMNSYPGSLCFGNDSPSIVLNGVSSSLIKVAASPEEWRLRSNPDGRSGAPEGSLRPRPGMCGPPMASATRSGHLTSRVRWFPSANPMVKHVFRATVAHYRIGGISTQLLMRMAISSF